VSAEHTPGPWLLDDENGVIANNQVIAYAKAISHPILRKVDVEQWNANACLIAAAPDLLEALDEMLDDIGRANSMPSAIKARAAIAKATGAAS
jgi:hypothetical protein